MCCCPISEDHAYYSLVRELEIEDGEGGKKKYFYFSLPEMCDERYEDLPYSIRILLESAIRRFDNFTVTQKDVENLLNWTQSSMSSNPPDIPFTPARVLLQDFTGVPAIVDLAAMRDAMYHMGEDPLKINPLVPVDLIIDHSVQVDIYGSKEALEQNQIIEFQRNYERFSFLKWGAVAFKNMLIAPPGSGIVHQVNLEYLARVVFEDNGVLYPDSLVGTDSHTTMIDGLGIAGWGVGGIEAEAVMLGNPISMVLPEVVGFKMTGCLPSGTTSTDLVLRCTEMLRKRNVVGKFVEFFGAGVATLSLADRATIANMAPEYGATMGFFPVDKQALVYLKQTGRTPHKIQTVEKYLRAQNMFKTYQPDQKDPTYSGDILHLDLNTVTPSLAGPKRPHDRVSLTDMKSDFNACLTNRVSFKGFGLSADQIGKSTTFDFQGQSYTLNHGSVVISAITSCTNTSNPTIMLAAGLIAKHAVEKGLKVAPYIKTSLSPGSSVVTQYMESSGLLPYLEELGFYIAGYGCMTCIGNSGELKEEVANAITSSDLVVAAVLSGNRNFEGRVHELTRANYLASPPLCVAYALCGTVNIDLYKEPIGYDKEGKEVFLSDIFPSSLEISQLENKHVLPQLFTQCYQNIKDGNPRWNALPPSGQELYEWDESSTYIHHPPFFQNMSREATGVEDVVDGYCLLSFGDSITTDHISPAGKIAKNSPAAQFLNNLGIQQKDFNSYGSRRGNDLIMCRGTFANIRIINKLASKIGPYTLNVPLQQEQFIYDAAQYYINNKHPTIVLAGKEYGSGSSRDWAAKGPYLLGIKAVIAESFERIHRSNLVGMGILPCQFVDSQNADSLGLTGTEQFTILCTQAAVNNILTVQVSNGKTFEVKTRLDTEVELTYYRHGGILQYVLRKLANQN